MKLKQLLLKHKIEIVIAVLVSVVVSFPQMYFRFDHRNDGVYQGIELLPDAPWSPRVREVQDGYPGFGSIYYKEGKENPYLFQPLGSIIVGYIGKFFSLDINDTLLLSRLLLSPVAFFCIYGFVFSTSGKRTPALVSASVLLFADSLLSYSGISKIIHGVSPDDFLRISLPVNPAMIYIFFFGFLITFFKFYQTNNVRYGVLSAVLLGLNFYNYFYSWTFLYAFGGILSIIFIVQKRWEKITRIIAVFSGGLLVAVPYLLNMYNVTQHPAYIEVGERSGVVLSHTPLFVGFLILGAFVLFYFLFPRQDKDRYYFYFALLLTPWVTLNQQLLTGKILQAGHYHWYFHKPIAIIVFFIIFFLLISKSVFSSYKVLIALVILTTSISVGIFVQVNSYYYGNKDGGEIAIERQRYGSVVKWLDGNTNKEDVIFSNDEISHMVVIYTPLHVFFHRAAPYASLTATYERQLDVIFTFYRLRGVDAENAHDIFFSERGYISVNMYGIHYRDLFGSYEAIPDEKIEEIVSRYEKTSIISNAEWIRSVFKKYDVSHLVWDRTKDPDWQVEQYPFLEEITTFDDISIYRFIP